VVDFFGNVQNVEVENANATEPGSLKEDLAEIMRLVEKWQKRDEEYSAIIGDSVQNATEKIPSSSHVNLAPKKIVGSTKMAEDSNWGKQLVGLSVVGACTAIWVAGSILGRSAV
jgi:hypothetical protein